MFDVPLPNLADLRRAAGDLTDKIKLVRQARAQTLSLDAAQREREDAYLILSVHEPALYEQARQLSTQLEALLNAGRGDYVSVPRYWRDPDNRR